MSAVFAPVTDRSRAEPVQELHITTRSCINRSYARGFEAGDRFGYVRGIGAGISIGLALAVCAVALLKTAGVL